MFYVLSIGAGIEHLESILLSKELGYKVIAVDRDKSAVGLKFADISYIIDIKNEEEIINIAKKYNIKAVLPTPIGRYLSTVGAVNDALNLKGIGKESALKCVDKVEFNKEMNKKGVLCASQLVAKSKNEIICAINKIGIPCIIKPRFGSGNRGVRIIYNEYDKNRIISEHLNERGDDDSLIESQIVGREFGIDAVIYDGIFKLILVREKTITEIPYRQETGYICPADIEESLTIKIGKTIENACRGISIDNCLINADIIIDKNNKVYIIELSGRPSGYYISKKVIPYVTGINFLKEGLNMVLNREYNFTVKSNKLVRISFFSDLNHGLHNIPSNEKLKERFNLLDSNINIMKYDKIDTFTSGKDVYKRGFILLKGDSYKEMDENLKDIYSYLNSKEKY